jgi:hypothetical protein
MICISNSDMLYLLSSWEQQEQHESKRARKDKISGCSSSELNIIHLRSKYFLICKSCIWCASLLNVNKEITKCPGCEKEDSLDSIVIVDND